jgi:hypothetical protein
MAIPLSPHFVVRKVTLMYPSRVLDSGRTLLLHQSLVVRTSISNKSADNKAIHGSVSFCWLRASQHPETFVRCRLPSAVLQVGVDTFPDLFTEGAYLIVREATSALTMKCSKDAAVCHISKDSPHGKGQLTHCVVAHGVEVVHPSFACDDEEELFFEHSTDGEVLPSLFRTQMCIEVM